MTDTPRPAGAGSRRIDDRPPALEIVADADECPTEYTFVPKGVTDEARTTTWMTASADTVADLERCR